MSVFVSVVVSVFVSVVVSVFERVVGVELDWMLLLSSEQGSGQVWVWVWVAPSTHEWRVG